VPAHDHQISLARAGAEHGGEAVQIRARSPGLHQLDATAGEPEEQIVDGVLACQVDQVVETVGLVSSTPAPGPSFTMLVIAIVVPSLAGRGWRCPPAFPRRQLLHPFEIAMRPGPDETDEQDDREENQFRQGDPAVALLGPFA